VIQISDAARAPRGRILMPAPDRARTAIDGRGALAPGGLCGYLTISALAALEPVPVFRALKLAPVQSFATRRCNLARQSWAKA
jgi:hypothetical protein